MKKSITIAITLTFLNIISAMLHKHFIKEIEPFGSLSLGDLFSAMFTTSDQSTVFWIVLTTLICIAMTIFSALSTLEYFTTPQCKNFSFIDKLYNTFSNISEFPYAFILSLIVSFINITVFCIMLKDFIVVLIALGIILFILKSLLQPTT